MKIVGGGSHGRVRESENHENESFRFSQNEIENLLIQNEEE